MVAIHDVGEEDGVSFMVMPLLEGESLTNRLKRGPIPLMLALRLAIQAAGGLAEAHRRKFLHRDLKPANVWIEPRDGGWVKLLDFGLVVELEDAAGNVARGYRLAGTHGYMPPEQEQGLALSDCPTSGKIGRQAE